MIIKYIHTILKTRPVFILLIFIALIGAVLPSVYVINNVGGLQNWHGVLPMGQIDSLYYYARTHEVVDGHLLIGNPYYFEHRDTLTPAFFLPDIVAALPALIGIPFDLAMVVNLFVWGSVFLILTFILLRLLQLPKYWAIAGTVLTYVMGFTFIIRPTILQLIYPIFLVFLIIFLKFLYGSRSKHDLLLLSLVTALSFYSYSLLAYIISLILGMTVLWYVYQKDFKAVKQLVRSGILVAILLLPFLFVSLAQLGNPYYLETFARIGLIFTRMPAAEIYYLGRWIIIGLFALSLLWFFFPKNDAVTSERKFFWFVTGAGLLGGMTMNLFTNVDLSLAIHTGRFFFIWLTMMLSVLVYEWYTARVVGTHNTKNEALKLEIVKSITTLCIVVLAICIYRNTPPGEAWFFKKLRKEDLADKQEYAAPLKWLEENVREQSVVWANDSISTHIPILTRHYVLFHRDAGLHFLPDSEQIDRYLLSRNTHLLTRADLEKDVTLYAGHGLNVRVFYHNQEVKYCTALSRLGMELRCKERTTKEMTMGDEYFRKLEERFDEIKNDEISFLNTYHVGYRVIDQKKDGVQDVSTSSVLYDDGRFVITAIDAQKNHE